MTNKQRFYELQQLVDHEYCNLDIQSLFDKDQARFNKYQLTVGDVFLDYSKNKLNNKLFKALIKLAESAKVEELKQAMFMGEKINTSEDRAVLHTALRDFSDHSIIVDDKDVKPEILQERMRVKKLVEDVHSGQWRGFSDKVITDVVNIGIGGSDLGPKMVCEALKPYQLNKITVHFISNVDANSIYPVLQHLNPETTLFIICSKSFTTQETLLNGQTARKWLLNHFQDEQSVAKHFVAVSSALDKVERFGIDKSNCFAMWDWVGGRYSLWSSVGMAIIFAVGFERYQSLLKGACLMDQHFLNTPLSENMPVILALLSVLYSNCHHTQSQAILPYDEHLCYLVDYLQQADMESNGKSCDKNGKVSEVQTGVVLWGGVGTNGQHAFHQLLHQGNVMVPVDFIVAKSNPLGDAEHHKALLANCFAQSQALMKGKHLNEVVNELQQQGYSKAQIEVLAEQKVIAGNKPSNTLILESLNPFTLGQLIALYEHKIFVQGVIWQINSFDQWGVELGKVLGQPILTTIENEQIDSGQYDSSTAGLIKKVLS